MKNRADLVIYWGSNPIESHPRHLSRYTTFVNGRYREEGHHDRTLVVVDIRKTDTAKIADEFRSGPAGTMLPSRLSARFSGGMRLFFLQPSQASAVRG